MATFLFVTTLGGTAVAATGFDVTIPIDTVVRAPEGSVTHLATVEVAEDAAGQTCTVKSVGQNQHSVHPGNDLVVESGDSQVRLPDVESFPAGTVTADGLLTLGSTIAVSLDMGPDKVFSGGFDVVLDCDPIPGRIVVVKNVAEGSDTSQSFDFTASYDSEGFALSHGEQNDSGELAPGTYTVSESVPDGWTLQSATCDDESPGVDEIQLDAGETVTCTFVNDQIPPEPGRIIVVKEVATDNPEEAPPFEFTASYDSEGFALSHGEQNDSGELAPGTYSVSEPDLDGWTVQSATCDDESLGVHEIQLDPGETVTCTFVNQVDDLVGASIQVTVEGFCEDDEDGDSGLVDITMSVAEGATVVVRDSAGETAGTLTSDGTIAVPDDATYTWEATPSEGFEFPSGFESSGSITIDDCSEPETLPFTGPETEWMPALGIALLAAGSAVLFSVRKREEY